ncbi:AMP-binding protein [Calditerrivibrio nitroreducens]|uniref:AMP-dependent synthetase and ligase n=1 Tax=Calditerrivibrio nitroreducens (strain DSM 19672 / NBRC 101217 / Yu37-1) TaxID=768670 RepID=E4TGL7_CALNY|nr:AMP-binding protein [Calditerrivibrio nitroreducens]ADR19730.1 AMP-dependent synthetase and ligase [Calditerrivibrio nitroreducens DSM 19672]
MGMTLLHYFFERYKKNPKKVSFREKDLGIWKEYTWTDYFEKVTKVAIYFESLGLKKGDTIAIIGDNKPEWIISEIAAQLLGAYPIGIYQDSISSEVEYILTKAESKVVVAEDQEQVDKVLENVDKFPQLKKIIYYDSKGMYQYRDELLIFFDDIFQQVSKTDLDSYFEEKLKLLNENDIAVMCTTSGTTGHPKLAMLSHKNMIFMATSLAKADPKYESDEFVSFLPLPWIGEQMMSVASALIFGFTVNFPESHNTVQEDMKEIGPRIIFSPPRVWENIASSVNMKIMDATPFKRFIYNLCLPIGYKYAELKFDKKKPSFFQKIQYIIAYILLFRKLKERLGFSFLRSAMTGGAALGPDTFKFFHALGIELKQIYGQTEIAGISCIHRSDDIDFTSVGKPIEGTEVRITEAGEIISRSDAVFVGYYKDEKATAETVRDGWLYSGDAGYFDDNGKLVVIDRMKDLMYLSDGTRFSPQFIENKLKFSPFIKEAVVLGDKKDYITAIINIDMGIVGKWAEDNKIAYTTYTDLSAKEEVYDLILKEVDKVNAQLIEKHRVKKFVLLYKELDADDGELTRTRKVRRGFIIEKYQEIFNALYTDAKDVFTTATIKLQDGRIKTFHTTLKIMFVK